MSNAVIALLDLTWNHTNQAGGHSYERLNYAMQQALTLAIGAGFPWQVDDMAYIATHYRFGYWCRESPEWIYTLAVHCNNLAAAQSYEAWQGRKPFIADQVEPPGYGSRGFLHRSGTRQRGRLA